MYRIDREFWPNPSGDGFPVIVDPDRLEALRTVANEAEFLGHVSVSDAGHPYAVDNAFAIVVRVDSPDLVTGFIRTVDTYQKLHHAA